ncbi:MAG: phytanoyl-CoA dioxygenase family protein [Acidimicrobiaceae bacterium]|nr:phytanoyl-CoA dioxygenase family protein [Acidimicrobiaceae bacterium]
MDRESIRATFADRGVVRLDGAFSRDGATRLGDVIWRYAERKVGVKHDDPSTWPTGWLPISWKGLKGTTAFEVALDNRAVATALDAIFDPGGWRRPKPGAQVLFTLPAPGPWALPDSWHMDCGFEEPTWPVRTVKMFGFFGEVGPCGGGTMLLPGSHRLVDRYRSAFEEPPGGGKANWQRFLRHHPPLGDLLTGARQPDLGRSMIGDRYEIDDVPVEVVELTGAPGDVVITHLHVFHAASPNTSDTPRQMFGKVIAVA